MCVCCVGVCVHVCVPSCMLALGRLICWVEESGNCQLCRAHGASLCDTTVERKVDLLTAELKNYNISTSLASRRPRA